MDVSLIILRVACILFSLGNIALSAYYFYRVKSLWRYIKLWYITANLFILILVVQSIYGRIPDGDTQILAIAVLLSSQFGGLIVSFTKLRFAEQLNKLLIPDEEK